SVSSATFDFPGALFQWSGGFLAGTLTNANVMNLSGAGTKRLYGTLYNRGTVIQDGVGSFTIDALNNTADGFYDLTADGSILLSSAFNNAGTFRKADGNGASEVQGAFSSSGTNDLRSGTVRFTQSFSQTAGATLLNGGALAGTVSLNFSGGILA